MIFEFQTTGAKLAGALNSLAYDEEGERDGGFVVAALKRALNYLHKSIAASERVIQKNLLSSERMDSFRSDHRVPVHCDSGNVVAYSPGAIRNGQTWPTSCSNRSITRPGGRSFH